MAVDCVPLHSCQVQLHGNGVLDGCGGGSSGAVADSGHVLQILS